MGNPRFLKVVNNIVLNSFSETPYVTIQFHQQYKGKRYYRLKCVANSYVSTFPTTYIYLGAYESVPDWNYTVSFQVESVKNASLQDTSFEALFTQFSTSYQLYPTVTLQSSATASFSSYETNNEQRLLSIELSGNNFGPTWTCPTWLDLRYATLPGVATLTGSNQKGVQGVSRFRFNFTQATARYGTSIEKYSVTVTGGFSHNLTPSHVANVGTNELNLKTYYKLVGNVSVVFTVEDTRGMTTSFTRTITILPYKDLYLTSNNTHRQGGTGSTVILDFSGKWYGSPLSLTCTGITAKEEGSSSTFANLTPTISIEGTSFSYKAVWSGVTFDPEKAYTVTAVFTDTIKTVTLTLAIPVGTPVLTIRNKKVGVNNPSPTYAFDVGGVIAQNGYPIMGYMGEIGTSSEVDLNDYTTTGYYLYTGGSADVYHFPNISNNNAAVLLRVISAGNYRIQILFYLGTGIEYTRTYSNGWTSWR